MLHAYGLVEENLKASIREPRIPSSLSKSQSECDAQIFQEHRESEGYSAFRLSPLGDDFLKVIGLPKPTAAVA